MEYCQACRRQTQVKYVEFYQNIGMLIMRQMRSVKGRLCKQCAKKYFWKLTGLTLLTGWWGMISFILNPFLILNNIIRICTCLGMSDAPSDGGLQAVPGKVAGGSQAQPMPPTPMAGTQTARPLPPTGLAAFRQDIQIRLRGGQMPGEIAQYVAPRAGVSMEQAMQFVESLRTAR